MCSGITGVLNKASGEMHKLERTHSFYDKCGNYEAVDTSFLASSDYF